MSFKFWLFDNNNIFDIYIVLMKFDGSNLSLYERVLDFYMSNMTLVI